MKSLFFRVTKQNPACISRAPFSLAISSLFISSPKQYLTKNTNNNAPHTVLSSPRLLSPSLLQIFFSIPCSRTPSVYARPLMRDTLFKQRKTVILRMLFILYIQIGNGKTRL